MVALITLFDESHAPSLRGSQLRHCAWTDPSLTLYSLTSAMRWDQKSPQFQRYIHHIDTSSTQDVGSQNFRMPAQSPQITSCLDYGSMTCKYIMTHCTKAGWRCYFKPITTFTRGSALIRKEEREEGILEATIAPMRMVMAWSK